MSTSQNPIFAIRKKPDQSFACVLSEKLDVLAVVVKSIADTNNYNLEELNNSRLPRALEYAFEDFNEVFELYHYENFELNIPTEKKLLELSEKLNETPYNIIEKMLKDIKTTTP